MADLYLAGYDMVPQTIIEEFESLIWTERFQGHGDFSLVVKERPAFLQDLRNYQYMRLSESRRVMMIEKVVTGAQQDGENIVTITGRSFEYFLTMRSNQTIDSNEIAITMQAGQAARYFVERYCINPATTAQHNLIPYLKAPSYAYSGDPAVTIIAARKDIYTIVNDICVGAGLGWRIDKQPSGDLAFYAYRGADRTDPSGDDYLEYSPDAENFDNVTSAESMENYKNNARVIGFKDIVDVYTPGTPSSVAGLERRTIVVEAREIGDEQDESTLEEQKAALYWRGVEALADANNSYNRLIDGEVPPDAWADGIFNLGDAVVVKDYYGLKTIMLVSEQIYSINNAGEESLIPTFQEIAGM